MRKIPYINLVAQNAPLKEEILQAIGKVIDRGDFILGQAVSEFEDKVAEYCGTKYAVGVSSGTDALFLGLKAFDIGPGDEVITVPNSFLSSASVIVATGAKPVFVDIREDLNIDPYLIEPRITVRTKAIMPVHLTGRPADMIPILGIAKKYNLKIIEDAAQAMGAEYDGKRVGSLGDIGCFSLHPVKIFNAIGDGGFITVNDKKLCSKLKQLRNIGLKNRNEADIWGYNCRLDTVQAAVMNVKLKYLDGWIKQQRANAEFYIKNLDGLVDLPLEKELGKAIYHTFIIQTSKRDELLKYLFDKGIDAKIHYPIPIHMQKAAASLDYKKGDLPVCDKTTGMILSLPIHYALQKEELSYIVEKTRKFFEK